MGEQIPDHFKVGFTISSFKKGSKNEWTIYRGITVFFSAPFKEAEASIWKILKIRVKKYEWTRRIKLYFTLANLILHVQVTDKRLAHNLKTHLIYIYWYKAIDRVLLTNMWQAMRSQNIAVITLWRSTVTILKTPTVSR